MLTTTTASPGSIRFATAISIAVVPEPENANGCDDGAASQTRRIISSEAPNASMTSGARCPGGGTEYASRTASETSTGPGIMTSRL